MGDKGRQRETKQNHLSPASEGDKGKQRETKGNKAKSSQPSLQTRHGRQRETNHLSPASRHAMGDKERQSKHAMGDKGRRRETKQNHLSPASRHATGDKGSQSKIISAQRPDTPWETRRNKAKRTHASIQTRHGRQGETKGDKSAQHPSIQTHHGRQGEAKGDFFSKQTTSPNYLRLYKTLPEVPHGCRNITNSLTDIAGLPRATIHGMSIIQYNAPCGHHSSHHMGFAPEPPDHSNFCIWATLYHNANSTNP